MVLYPHFFLVGLSMDFTKEFHHVHEHNQKEFDEPSSYNQLSLAQKMSASQLSQFGFELNVIEGDMFERMAVFTNDSLSVTVDYYGEVGSLTTLYFRK